MTSSIGVFDYCVARADEHAKDLAQKMERGEAISDMDSNLECALGSQEITGAKSSLYILSHVVYKENGKPAIQTLCTNVEPKVGLGWALLALAPNCK